MTALAGLKCFHHAERAAAARCPRCTRHFCRECITEHGPTLLCAACLREETSGVPEDRHSGSVLLGRVANLRPLVHLAAAVFVLWVAFFTIGKVLLAVPTEMHGTESSFMTFFQGLGS